MAKEETWGIAWMIFSHHLIFVIYHGWQIYVWAEGHGPPSPPNFKKSKISMYIYIELHNLVPKIYILAPFLKILFKLAHEIKTKNLFDHSCIPFAQEKQKP